MLEQLANAVGSIIGWQFIVVSMTCWGIAQLAKAVIDLRYPKTVFASSDSSSLKRALAVKLVERPKWISTILLPSIPISAGFVLVAFVPIRPEVITDFVDERVAGFVPQTLIYGLYGGLCGQFSAWTYDRIRAVIKPPADFQRRDPVPPPSAGGTEERP